MELFKKAIAEFVGTLVLVFVGCGVAVATGADEVATALAFGLSIVAMAYSIGKVSGCHINPAVSIAMLVSKKMSVKEFFVYIAAQIVGAIAGAGLLEIVFMGKIDEHTTLGSNTVTSLTTNFDLNEGSALAVGFLVEVVLTFIFVLAILGVTSKKEESSVSGIVIGLTLTLVHLMGIPLTGTSVNPARSIGPAIFAAFNGDLTPLKQIWIFILAPLAGGVLAALVWKALSKSKEKKEIAA